MLDLGEELCLREKKKAWQWAEVVVLEWVEAAMVVPARVGKADDGIVVWEQDSS